MKWKLEVNAGKHGGIHSWPMTSVLTSQTLYYCRWYNNRWLPWHHDVTVGDDVNTNGFCHVLWRPLSEHFTPCVLCNIELLSHAAPTRHCHCHRYARTYTHEHDVSDSCGLIHFFLSSWAQSKLWPFLGWNHDMKIISEDYQRDVIVEICAVNKTYQCFLIIWNSPWMNCLHPVVIASECQMTQTNFLSHHRLCIVWRNILGIIMYSMVTKEIHVSVSPLLEISRHML